MRKEILALPGLSPTPLRRRTHKAVQDIDHKLMSLVRKWRFLKSGVPMIVEKYDGSLISYQGVAFSGSPVQVFWNGFIEPYIENYSLNVLEQTSTLAHECQFLLNDSIEEAKLMLLVMVRRVYGEMAETDRILSGNGFTFPEKKDVSGKIENMSSIISEHAEVEKLKRPKTEIQTYNINNVHGNNLQIGGNNSISISPLDLLFEKIILSGDQDAISLLKQFLENKTISSIIESGKRPHAY